MGTKHGLRSLIDDLSKADGTKAALDVHVTHGLKDANLKAFVDKRIGDIHQ